MDKYLHVCVVLSIPEKIDKLLYDLSDDKDTPIDYNDNTLLDATNNELALYIDDMFTLKGYKKYIGPIQAMSGFVEEVISELSDIPNIQPVGVLNNILILGYDKVLINLLHHRP